MTLFHVGPPSQGPSREVQLSVTGWLVSQGWLLPKVPLSSMETSTWLLSLSWIHGHVCPEDKPQSKSHYNSLILRRAAASEGQGQISQGSKRQVGSAQPLAFNMHGSHNPSGNTGQGHQHRPHPHQDHLPSVTMVLGGSTGHSYQHGTVAAWLSDTNTAPGSSPGPRNPHGLWW